MNRLDPLTLPMDGIRLIEASAGTGKTHAITTLYLRLVLGINGEVPRRVQDILVVTFTRAATGELRGRVRLRLFEALNVLEGIRSGTRAWPESSNTLDMPLRELLAKIIAEGRRDESIIRLRLEIAAIDDAAIFTIHGFCQRALQEQAFDSGEDFEIDLVQDDRLRELQAVQDHWRTRYYGNDMLAAVAHRHFVSPQILYEKVRPLLRPGIRLQYENYSPEKLQQQRGALVTAWRAGSAALAGKINDFKALSRGPYKPESVAAAVAALNAWCAGTALELPPEGKLFLRKTLDDNISKAQKAKGICFPDEPLVTSVTHYQAGSAGIEQTMLADAAADIRARLDTARHQAGSAAFDDIIMRLAAALAGPTGARLAQALARRYPVVLIDEFQDTDPLQYGIFARIHGNEAAGQEGSALLLIGDPKQAIYSFRGADIFAYMQARNAAGAQRRYSLDTNWRSVTPLVGGVNALFSRRTEPFLFADAIAFQPTRAAGNADSKRLVEPAGVPVPLEFWLLPDGEKGRSLSKEKAAEIILAQTARRIAALLASGRRDGKPLVPRDIAVLVRTHAQGAQVQAALREIGIGSAMAGTQNVFATAEAAALRDVLTAIAEPANDRALRRALVSPLWPHEALFLAALGEEAADQQAASQGDNAYETLLRDLHAWHDAWLTRGFMPMFRAFLHGSGAAAVVLAQPDGERRLTNVGQLAELLQQAAREHPSPESLLRWLEDNMTAPDAAAEAQQLRLESDADLVQVLTLHRSKGLEYPVVFLPFMYDTKPVNAKKVFPRFHDEQGRLCVDLAGDDNSVARAEYERLAEDMRLLYVALTRAQDYCIVPWGHINLTDRSALAFLLHGPDDLRQVDALAVHMKSLALAELRVELDTLAAGHPDQIRVIDIADATAATAPVPAVAAMPASARSLAARTTGRRVQCAYITTSYSGLVEGVHDQARDLGVRREIDADATAPLLSVAPPLSPQLSPFTLAGGTTTGHLFHDILEDLDYRTARGESLRNIVTRELGRRAMPAAWCDTVAGMIETTLDAPLDASGFHLRLLDPSRRRNEMEFWYPLENLRADALEALLPGLGDGIRGPRLAFAPAHGLLQGFIDLIFEHDGRWYVADWKTNKLGPNATWYTGEHLARAIAHSRYDLQYTLYTVALHRHLRRALGTGYDPARHLGGVYYLFLRGMSVDDPARPGQWYVPADVERITAIDALLQGNIDKRRGTP